MPYFAVRRERGRRWDALRAMREQDGWHAHAKFMDTLVDDGFVVLGGPLGDGTQFLLVVEAEDEAEIEARLADDPWTPAELLRTSSIDPWQILLKRSM
jgi:uncharacterized protein YciI